MSLQRVTDTLICADIGTAWTRALLINRVSGSFRVVAAGEAATTIAAPHGDVRLGLQNAIRQLEQRARRRLLDESGALIREQEADWNGVDLLLLTTSAAPALTVAVGGLVSRVSVASAVRAAQSTYSRITQAFALDAPEGRWGSAQGVSGVIASLLADFPDAIVLTGGAEGGNDQNLLELAEGIALATGAAQREPTIIFAGNSQLRERIAERLKPHRLIVANNLRPAPEQERLRSAARHLDAQFRERNARNLPGLEALGDWGTPAPVPTVEAFGHLVEYLAIRNEQSVLGVDIGAGALSLAATFADRVTQSAVRRDLGLAAPSSTLTPDEMTAWVALDEPPESLYNRWVNTTLAPAQLPADETTLAVMQGVARGLIQRAVNEAGALWRPAGEPPRFDVILGAGRAIRDTPRPIQALLMLVDGVQPGGITRFFRDRLGFATAVGALSEQEPLIAAALMSTQSFESLGSVISPTGVARPGAEVIRFRLKQADGRTEGVVHAGELFTFPTRQSTELFVQPARHMDIGFGEGVGVTLIGEGDSVGFVIDARGRPLTLPSERNRRFALLEEWNRYAGA